MSIGEVKTTKILAIETSCDETSASLCEAKFKIKSEKLKVIEDIKIISNIVSSQVKLHAKYGGVYPELASREHIRNVLPVIQEAINISETLNSKFEILNKFKIPNSNVLNIKNLDFNKNLKLKIKNYFDVIAVTNGPGLIGSLLVGVNTAKTLAYTLQKPIYPINHLEGHIYSCFAQVEQRNIETKEQKNSFSVSQFLSSSVPELPAVVLVVSGGHTSLVYMKDHLQYKIIGQTLDDAAGEAFDKVAALLGLGYPGGPLIAKMAMKNPKSQFLIPNKMSNSKIRNWKLEIGNSIKFPRPMINSKDFNFSFSGLKTAVLYTVKKLPKSLSPKIKALICKEFQNAVVETLVTKTLQAAKKYKARSILLCGGVAANSRLREEFSSQLDFFVPPKNLCTDNAAMIGIAATYRLALGKKPTPWYDVNADANLKLEK